MKTGFSAFADIKTADQKGRVVLGSRYAGKRFAFEEQENGTAVLVPVVVVSESEQSLTSRYLTDQFAALRENRGGSDDSPSPVPERIDQAKETLALLQASALARGVRWHDPNISGNERGEVVLEWWWQSRSLTVFVGDRGAVRYLKAWGANIESEREDGELNRISDFVSVAHWLYGGSEKAA